MVNTFLTKRKENKFSEHRLLLQDGSFWCIPLEYNVYQPCWHTFVMKVVYQKTSVVAWTTDVVDCSLAEASCLFIFTVILFILYQEKKIFLSIQLALWQKPSPDARSDKENSVP